MVIKETNWNTKCRKETSDPSKVIYKKLNTRKKVIKKTYDFVSESLMYTKTLPVLNAKKCRIKFNADNNMNNIQTISTT